MPGKHSPSDTIILLVEDDEDLRLTVSEMLADAGHATLVARDADEAMVLLRTTPGIGTVFTDLDMPGSMDGLDLCERVAEEWPHIRLVLASGRHHLSDLDLPDQSRFVPKPYRRRDVLGAIMAAS